MNYSFLIAAATYFRYCDIDHVGLLDDVEEFAMDSADAELVAKVADFYDIDVDAFEAYLNDEDNEVVLALSLLREFLDVNDDELDQIFGA